MPGGYNLMCMAVEKEFILQEIRRCAAENGDVPLGLDRFEAETGINPNNWRGRYWVTWSDAVVEAGFRPNMMQQRNLDDYGLLRRLAMITRKLGHFPTHSEINFEHHSNRDVPTGKTFRERLGYKGAQIDVLRAFVEGTPEFADVAVLLPDAPEEQVVEAPEGDADASQPVAGYVYLVRSGTYYKIGRSNDPGRRTYEVRLQLPEKLKVVHTIETDDAVGIERYWHERFKNRRCNGEWFLLAKVDVAAFKRRRAFM